jgi:DNA transformation protein
VVASDNFAEFLREQLAPLGRVTMLLMFGKTGVSCDGGDAQNGDGEHPLFPS